MAVIIPFSQSVFAGFSTIIDVRTPKEFEYDHLPGAINLPVLSNEERHQVGTLYAHSPFLGRQQGAALIAKNIAHQIEQQFAQYPQSWRPLIYCWRGGKRSAALAYILNQIGWRAGQLQGGYKAFRREVIYRIESTPSQLTFVVIGGKTGCQKTRLLKKLTEIGAQVLDLEALAKHKGSMLGGNPLVEQPSQPKFETRLYQALEATDKHRVVFVEAESRRIGKCHLPTSLITIMRASKMVVLESNMSMRVATILQDYQSLLENPDWLIKKMAGLAAFHSNAQMEEWQLMSTQANWAMLAESLMTKHYDPIYQKSLAKNYAGVTVETYPMNSDNDLNIAATTLKNQWDGVNNEH